MAMVFGCLHYGPCYHNYQQPRYGLWMITCIPKCYWNIFRVSLQDIGAQNRNTTQAHIYVTQPFQKFKKSKKQNLLPFISI